MSSSLPFLQLLLFSTLVFYTSASLTIIDGICPKKMPQLAKVGDSCGIPPFVDSAVFGDNADTNGVMRVYPTKQGLDLSIIVKNLPKPNLVLTAWLIWTPFGVTTPKIFEVANHASPCAPFTAKFGTGLSRDPNTLVYSSKTSARMFTRLNFNPTYAHEGALTRETFSFQKDVVGIQNKWVRQYPTPGGVFIPTSSSYLRRYSRKTGFEKLNRSGRPYIVRSPVKALGVEIIAHVDKTTHGISQGVGGVDHYFVLFFPFEKALGKPTRGMRM